MYISYKFGRNKYLDSFFFVMMTLYIITMQYRLVWDGYGKMVYSYHKYTSNQKDYCIKNAEVINTKIHTLAGLRGFISCDMRYCTLRYDFNGISYETFTEIFPEYSEGKVIKIAVDYSNPQIINRVEPYSVSDYRWGAQIVVIIFAVLIIKFASALKFVYDTN